MKNTTAIMFVLTAIAIIVLAPFLLIWALNTLFALGIEYTIWTWLASLVLTSTFGKANISLKDK